MPEICLSESFIKDYEHVKPDIKKAALQQIQKLKSGNKGTRAHIMKGVTPKQWKIDVLGNKSWQILFRFVDEKIVLLRLVTHSDADRFLRS